MLPTTYYVQCDGDSNIVVSNCVKTDERALLITFATVSSRYNSAEPFSFFVRGVSNPASFKESGPFSNIKLVSRSGNEIAKFEDSRLTIKNSIKSSIANFSLR